MQTPFQRYCYTGRRKLNIQLPYSVNLGESKTNVIHDLNWSPEDFGMYVFIRGTCNQYFEGIHTTVTNLPPC